MSAATANNPVVNVEIDSRSVAQSFSKAAASYDAIASVQRDIAQYLTDQLALPQKGRFLDLGCGTGYLMHRLALPSHTWCGADIAAGMLEQVKLRQWTYAPELVVANAEALPFEAESFDTVVSSMALQWVNHPVRALAEIKRIIKPAGKAHLAILRRDSLAELHQGWESLQQGYRVNRFAGREEWILAAQQAGLNLQAVSQSSFVTLHSALRPLLHSIKDIGAGATNACANGMDSRPHPRITKQDLRSLEYWWRSHHAQHEQLRLTYKVDFFHFSR
jgi:malonyl-CoA O-methyltransferase